jgi:hypothetical protein
MSMAYLSWVFQLFWVLIQTRSRPEVNAALALIEKGVG